jgi:hypothetical protein
VDKGPLRELTRFEEELTLRLLEIPLQGRNERADSLREALIEQIPRSRVRTIAEGADCLLIEWELPPDWPALHHPIVEGWAEDADGMSLMAFLFEADGRLWGLDIIRADGSPIVRMPEVSEFLGYVAGDLDSAVPPWPIGKRPRHFTRR